METFGYFRISMILRITKSLLLLVLIGGTAMADTQQEIKLGPSCITSECRPM